MSVCVWDEGQAAFAGVCRMAGNGVTELPPPPARGARAAAPRGRTSTRVPVTRGARKRPARFGQLVVPHVLVIHLSGFAFSLNEFATLIDLRRAFRAAQTPPFVPSVSILWNCLCRKRNILMLPRLSAFFSMIFFGLSYLRNLSLSQSQSYSPESSSKTLKSLSFISLFLFYF